MYPENQPSNQQPDYGFITQQPGAPQTSKKILNRSKLVIIGGMLAALLVASIVSFVLIPKLVLDNDYNKAKQKAAQFFEYVSDGNTSAAYNLYVENGRPQEKFFSDNFATPIAKRFNLKECANSEGLKTATKEEISLQYDCPSKTTSSTASKVTLRIVMDRNKKALLRVEMVTN